MLVASPRVTARALPEHQQTSKNDCDRKEAKHNILCCAVLGHKNKNCVGPHPDLADFLTSTGT
eukprot:5279988-Heterocapsa_arctica.AAC.1